MIEAITFVLAAAAAWYVSAPLRPKAFASTLGSSTGGRPGAGERARLVREREAALRTLRDLELDHATGKMSDADYEGLRAQQEAAAIAALRSLDAFDAVEGESPAPSDPRPSVGR